SHDEERSGLNRRAATAIATPGKPGYAADHSCPCYQPRKVADLDGMRQQSQAAEDSDPVMLGFIGDGTDGDQRQFQPKSVRHVSGDARETVKERERAERRAGNLATDGKAHCQQRWNQQLKQRTSPKTEGIPQPAKEQMPAFMNRKVDIIEQRQLPPVQ